MLLFGEALYACCFLLVSSDFTSSIRRYLALENYALTIIVWSEILLDLKVVFSCVQLCFWKAEAENHASWCCWVVGLCTASAASNTTQPYLISCLWANPFSVLQPLQAWCCERSDHVPRLMNYMCLFLLFFVTFAAVWDKSRSRWTSSSKARSRLRYVLL